MCHTNVSPRVGALRTVPRRYCPTVSSTAVMDHRVGGVGLEKNSGYRVKIAASEKRLFVTTTQDRVHAVEACTVGAFGRCLR